MAWTNILSRKFNQEFINLGFSGNGCGEPALAHLMCQIAHPHVFILDYEANAGTSLNKTLPIFIRILRETHPKIPIVVMSRVVFARDRFYPKLESQRVRSVKFQRQLVSKLRAKGDRHIFFIDGGKIERFEESTVDGVHPTDLGFIQIADHVADTLKTIL